MMAINTSLFGNDFDIHNQMSRMEYERQKEYAMRRYLGMQNTPHSKPDTEQPKEPNPLLLLLEEP